MFSDMLTKLWENGIIQQGIWETVYMTVISSLIALLLRIAALTAAGTFVHIFRIDRQCAYRCNSK